MTLMTDENNNLRYIEDNKNQSFPEYLKNKVDQRIEICRKRLREAEQRRDLTEYIRMEAKIEAYSDIWSFLENKDNLIYKLGRLEDDPIILKYMKEMVNQMKIQTDYITKNKEK